MNEQNPNRLDELKRKKAEIFSKYERKEINAGECIGELERVNLKIAKELAE